MKRKAEITWQEWAFDQMIKQYANCEVEQAEEVKGTGIMVEPSKEDV